MTFPRKEGSGNLAWPLEPKIPPQLLGDPTRRAGKSRRHKVHEKAYREKVLKQENSYSRMLLAAESATHNDNWGWGMPVL